MAVFFELSDYVLRADLDVLFGPSFAERNADSIVAAFRGWVENISRGANPATFFDEVGCLLREELAMRAAKSSDYELEQSVLQVYLEGGALNNHDEDGVVGLLSMTMMAAVFNTQVTLAWILVHLYSEPELLRTAREEIARCPSFKDGRANYSDVQQFQFLNSCIDEAVRLHTMLPGNTVLRKAKREVWYGGDAENGGTRIPSGAILWLYPNAVHLDENFFPEPTSFCPMRLLSGNREKMNSEYELVTFGHGQKRCIGEKMARAMICSFLAVVLRDVEATTPEQLPADEFFDLIPASKLRLLNLRRSGASLPLLDGTS